MTSSPPLTISSLGTPRGAGRAVLLVHGVGPGPETFAATATGLAAGGSRVHVLDRTRAAGSPLEEQVDAAAAAITALGEGPVRWVGVSGGATLGLLAALRAPEVLVDVVAHEPLAGPLLPELHAVVSAASRRLAATPGDPAAVAFVRDLLGPRAWDALDAVARARVADRSAAIRAEVPRFASFAPSPGALAACRVTVTVTVGSASPPIRHRAARRLAAVLGGEALPLPGVGHLPQLEDPDGFARAVRAVRPPDPGSGSAR